MDVLKLETGPARDKYVPSDLLFVTLEFSETDLTISIGRDCPEECRCVCVMWEHTVYELEKLSEGLRFAAEGRMPEYFEVPSRDMLIGPTVGLPPAMRVYLGHAPIGCDGLGALFYCSLLKSRIVKRDLICMEAVYAGRSAEAILEVETVLEFADRLYEKAKELAVKYVSWDF